MHATPQSLWAELGMAMLPDIDQGLRPRWPRLDRTTRTLGARLVARRQLLMWAALAAIAVLMVLGSNVTLSPGLVVGAAWMGLIVWAASTALPSEQSGSESSDAALATASGTTGGGPGGSPTARSIIQALSDPAFTIDRNFEILEANAAAQEVFNGVRLGRHLSLTSRDPELAAAVGEAVRMRQRKTFVLEMRTPLERHLEGVAAPLDATTEGANDAVVLVYLHDLTEQDRLSAMRADFVANASHELRTPLASLKGFIETLQGPARGDVVAQGRFLDIMNAQAERMTRLIDDMLSLSRIETRAHIPPSDLVNLAEIAGSVVAALEPQARLAEMTVTIHPTTGSALVRGDHDELVQAVQNLVQNAIKYGRPNGRVDVRIGQDAGHGQGASQMLGKRMISISDDGPGIAPEHLPRLTERFYRVNVASSRDRGGTGLGLAIVKHIVTRHRGSLSIASTVGKGSTFRIVLPAA